MAVKSKETFIGGRDGQGDEAGDSCLYVVQLLGLLSNFPDASYLRWIHRGVDLLHKHAGL